MRRLLAIGLVQTAASVALAAAALTLPGHTEAALRPCAGRSVYVQAGHALGCDVRPPQRLHLLRSSQAQCDHAGGRFDRRSGICWDVDF